MHEEPMVGEDPMMREASSNRREVCSNGKGACGDGRGCTTREDFALSIDEKHEGVVEELVATEEDAC